MPDTDFQRIVLNLIPKQGEQPVVFYASQYETARPFIAVLKWGDSEYAPGVDCYAEIDIRKNDDNLVVITDDISINNNEVSVVLPVQALTCIGKNLGQVKIYSSDDHLIAALNFILEVQADPLAGGVTSETAIDNLESQIEDIATEVIGENYYNKTETDALLADKADKSELPDMTDYYTKTQTDNLLNDKADTSDLATLASKAELTQAINDEDTSLKNWAYTQFATPGYVASHYYTKLQIDDMLDNIFPTLTASGPIASFTTALNKPLVSVTADPGATTITRCGKNLFDKTTTIDDNWINSSGSSVYFPGGFYSALIPVKPDTAYYLSNVIGGNDFVSSVHFDSDMNVIGTKNVSGSSIQSGSITTFNNSAYMRINSNMANKDTVMVSEGSTASEYEAYNGETVPVADATTLTTLSGVNYVFADSGNVTVQYKYMSM